MPWRRFVLGLAVGWLCLPATAWAILIEVNGVKVGGYFQSDDGKILTIKVRSTDGTEKIKEYERNKIKILFELDRKLLESFSKDNPEGYRDYAEKLAGQTEDPEARDTAMRLFLIAASLDPKKFGPSSLLRMSDLANSRGEARKCKALAYLLNPAADANLLKRNAGKSLELSKSQAALLRDFLKGLYYYRAGQIKEAKVVVKREGMDKIFGLIPGMVDQKTFLQWCTEGGKDIDIPDDNLRIILRAELWAVDQITGGNPGGKKGNAETPWSSILETRPLTPVLPLSLETITEFNPRDCLYRNGRWVAP